MIIKLPDGKKRTVYNWEDLPLVLDTTTTALILGTSEQTIFNWLNSGQLKARKIGRRWLIDREYIRSLVQDLNTEEEAS